MLLRMTQWISENNLAWGSLDLPLLGISHDWFGAPIAPLPGYALATDQTHLWFIATRQAPAQVHPQAKPGQFIEGLWEADVAELFLTDFNSGRYLEFNLAPNSAWWGCEFTSPRQRASNIIEQMPEVQTYADLAADGSWLAAMAIPLEILRSRIDFSPSTRANITMVLGAPKPQYFSVCKMPEQPLDFHQPAFFSQLDPKNC